MKNAKQLSGASERSAEKSRLQTPRSSQRRRRQRGRTSALTIGAPSGSPGGQGGGPAPRDQAPRVPQALRDARDLPARGRQNSDGVSGLSSRRSPARFSATI